MRAWCIAQRLVVVRDLSAQLSGTSTARLKSGADWLYSSGPSSAHRDFRPTFHLTLLPSHKPYSVRRNFDPSVHLLLFQQIKNWLFEHDWLARFREIQ
jgi:hypothetical protein